MLGKLLPEVTTGGLYDRKTAAISKTRSTVGLEMDSTVFKKRKEKQSNGELRYISNHMIEYQK